MPAKFNFLDRRTGLGRTTAELRAKHPKKSDTWINARARHVWNEQSNSVVRQHNHQASLHNRKEKNEQHT
jgi:hypothetical protein